MPNFHDVLWGMRGIYMKTKSEITGRIKESGLVAVIRAGSGDEASKIIEACVKGGVSSVEITFTVPGAENIIKELAGRYAEGKVLIGAGTVLDSETARIAILAGAQYIVSPCFDAETAKLCGRYNIAYIPGAMTVKETVQCMEAGCEIIKIFPGELFGPQIIKAIKGPLPQAQLMPTGGVSVDNAAEWIKAGAVALGAGGSLTAGAKTGDFEQITKTAEEFIKRIKLARE